jgi:endonuclease/exonuclease/phosphatase family metal-dependent hydrolase
MIITSFNILADVFIDFKKPEVYYPMIDKPTLKMKYRFDTLIQYIRGDIIMLQEVTPYIRRKLMAIFGEHYVVLPLSVHISNTETTGNLTLIKKNKFKTIYHSTLYINKNAVSVVNADNIDIYNIHLNDVSNVIRTKELKFIISTFNKNNNKKIIIGGDFNSDNEKLHSLLNDFKMNIEAKSTYLCESPMIDYIYVYGFKKATGYIDNTINNKNCYSNTIKKYGSDHHPVYVTVT